MAGLHSVPPANLSGRLEQILMPCDPIIDLAILSSTLLLIDAVVIAILVNQWWIPALTIGALFIGWVMVSQ